jgi:hypothetical protein
MRRSASPRNTRIALSSIRTVTVGPGVTPDLLTPLLDKEAGARGLMRLLAITAGGEFRPALRTLPTWAPQVNVSDCPGQAGDRPARGDRGRISLLTSAAPTAPPPICVRFSGRPNLAARASSEPGGYVTPRMRSTTGGKPLPFKSAAAPATVISFLLPGRVRPRLPRLPHSPWPGSAPSIPGPNSFP